VILEEELLFASYRSLVNINLECFLATRKDLSRKDRNGVVLIAGTLAQKRVSARKDQSVGSTWFFELRNDEK
jgi:hypothetical protein